MKDYSAKAKRMAARRAANPVREARRQAELTRMRRRIVDYVPRYIDTCDGRGVVIRARYIGHFARFATVS